jgi:histidinol-phosphate/aromatic aminotransferase/cobyric acid decarboxylase-like protein
MGIEVFPSYTNFFLAKLPEGILNDNGTRRGVWTRLVEEGIYIRNKSVMYSDSDLCKDMVRITLGEMDECERFIDKLKKILKDF